MISGNLSINTIEMPLVGRPSIVAVLTRDDGVAFGITNDSVIRAYVLRNPDDATSDALITRGTDLAVPHNLLVTAVEGGILIDLLTDVSLLTVQQIYSLLVNVIDEASGDIVLSNIFTLIPVNIITRSFTMALALSTRFVNTISITNYTGGSGNLDGIPTTAQPVGCWITFTRSGAQPEEWELIVWTSTAMNTDPGVYQLPIDFNASTNAKVWIRRS